MGGKEKNKDYSKRKSGIECTLVLSGNTLYGTARRAGGGELRAG
jgi:hypothetical protein